MKLFNSLQRLFTRAKRTQSVCKEDDPLITIRLSELTAYKSEIAALKATIEEMKVTISDLQEKLGTNSKNSSTPPSSDAPGDNPKKPKKKGGRKRGAQYGHKGKGRKLLPTEECDKVIPYYPQEECDCGGQVEVKSEPGERRQVIELPKEIKAIVTEHQIFSGKCSCCGKKHRGELPSDMPSGFLGPRILALTAILSGKYHLRANRHVQDPKSNQ